MNLYTLGYQGIDVSTYVRTLQNAGVGVVVDVRETPWSYKRSFCKGALSLELSRAGIDYVHLRSAGNPKENRRTASSSAECLKRYRKHLRGNPEALAELWQVISLAASQEKPACLTCFEEEPHECHRSILAAALRKISGDITTINLKGLAEKKVGALWVPEADNHEAVLV